MVKTRVKEVLNGEAKNNSVNSFKSGRVIESPNYLVQLFVNGQESGELYGKPTVSPDSDFDYLVSTEENVKMFDLNEFYEEKNVEMEVYTLKGGSVTVYVYRASEDGWNKV